MIKVGVTGQNGFVAKHLLNTLRFVEQGFEIVEFERSYFDDAEKLQSFVSQCDAIVHLAGLNRHDDEQVIYQTNIALAQKLVDACIAKNVAPHILFSSSTQEERDNPYGNSKKQAREILASWAKNQGAKFSGLVIPNVFGPFGEPFYNSVVATFCYQVTHGQTPTINNDGVVNLIYVSELVAEIIKFIKKPESAKANTTISPTSHIKVSKLSAKLNAFKEGYLTTGLIPNLDDAFDVNLFNTFLTYVDFDKLFPFKLTQHTDDRGSFVETMKLQSGGQVSFSTTVPGVTRGNHFHTRKAERFAVIQGKALIELRKIDSDEVYSFELDGSQPAFVDMPIWHTHNIKNIGDETLLTIFWINEHFNPDDGDTYFVKV